MCNHTDKQRETCHVLLVDDHHGRYSGQVFAEMKPALYDDGVLMIETLDALLAGPDQANPELYYDACMEIENGYIVPDVRGPRLHPQWLDGVLFGIEDDAEWCDDCDSWVMPFKTTQQKDQNS